MSNMSYCRFQNTLIDLLDCKRHWEDQDEDELSSDEKEARTELLAVCKKIVDRFLVTIE